MFVAIHGSGGVGLSAIMIAAVYGAKVIAVDINEENLQRAKSFGAAYTIYATKVKVVEKVLEITKDGADLSMDVLGSHETSTNSINCLAKKGKHIQVGILVSEKDIAVSTADFEQKDRPIITH